MEAEPVRIQNIKEILSIRAVQTLKKAEQKDIFCRTLTPEQNSDLLQWMEALYVYYKFLAACNGTEIEVQVEGYQKLDVCGRQTKLYGFSGLKILRKQGQKQIFCELDNPINFPNRNYRFNLIGYDM